MKADSIAFRRARWRASLAALSALAACYLYAPFAERGPVLCPLRGLTGLPCPSCGMLRALAALLHGDVEDALLHHALSPLVLVAALGVPLAGYVEVRRGSAEWRRAPGRSAAARALAGLVVALFAVHHGLRVARWHADGTLAREYLERSWTAAVVRRMR